MIRVLSCLGSSGRLGGVIFTRLRPDPTEWCRVMTKNVKMSTSIELMSIIQFEHSVSLFRFETEGSDLEK